MRRAAIALALAAVLLSPAAAGATFVGLGATAEEPGECVEPKTRGASAHCQIFAGESIAIAAVATRDDGPIRLAPQPFSLLDITRGKARAVLSFTFFDENDADDDPVVTPARNTDYLLRFLGNDVIPAAESAPLVAMVGARLTIPEGSETGRGTKLSIPARVTIPRPALKGRFELRRCHRAKALTARSCERRRDYTVLATRAAAGSRQVRLPVSAPPRTHRRYEIAFVPRSRKFTTTRQAFQVTNGFGGTTSYRHVVRANPFGTR